LPLPGGFWYAFSFREGVFGGFYERRGDRLRDVRAMIEEINRMARMDPLISVQRAALQKQHILLHANPLILRSAALASRTLALVNLAQHGSSILPLCNAVKWIHANGVRYTAARAAIEGEKRLRDRFKSAGHENLSLLSCVFAAAFLRDAAKLPALAGSEETAKDEIVDELCNLLFPDRRERREAGTYSKKDQQKIFNKSEVLTDDLEGHPTVTDDLPYMDDRERRLALERIWPDLTRRQRVVYSTHTRLGFSGVRTAAALNVGRAAVSKLVDRVEEKIDKELLRDKYKDLQLVYLCETHRRKKSENHFGENGNIP
jgi:hypothetical protein